MTHNRNLEGPLQSVKVPTEDQYSFDEETPPQPDETVGKRQSGSSRSRGKSKLSKALLLAVALPVIGIVAYPTIRQMLPSRTEKYANLVTETVKRGSFAITVTDNGELDSMQNSTLSSQVEKPTTILSIVEEGTRVKAPVLAQVAGWVASIRDSAEGEQVVTVRAGPGLIHTSHFFVYLEPVVTIEHTVKFGPHTAIAVVPGDRVQQGDFLAADVVCELDSAVYREQAKQQKILLTQAVAALEQAYENLEIQRAQNESDIAAAAVNLVLAKLDLKEYTEGKFKQLQNVIKGKITLAQQDLVIAKENYDFSKRIAKKGYRTENELETARIAVTRAEIDLKVNQEELKVLEDFEQKRKVAELRFNAMDMELEVERVRRKATAALSLFQSNYEASRLTADVEEDKNDRLLRQIAACTLRAPQEGQVVYAKPSSRSRETYTIEEGATIRERQAIIKLPDFSQMKVEAGVHESRISLVRVGLPVTVRVDAVHDEIFHGVVETVSAVPTPGRWPNYDLKEYPTSIRLTDSLSKLSKYNLKPGQTAQIEILVRRRDNVLQVPVQSVVTVGKRRVAFILTEKGPVRRDLKIGESSDTAVEILDGLEEGQQVVMNPRTHFAEELQELENAEKARSGKPDPDAGESSAPSPAPAAPKAGSGDAGKKKGGQKNQNRAGGGNPGRSFTTLDKNGDGKLTSDEVPPQMQQMFSSLDENGDGAVDRAEFGKRPRQGRGGPR